MTTNEALLLQNGLLLLNHIRCEIWISKQTKFLKLEKIITISRTNTFYDRNIRSSAVFFVNFFDKNHRSKDERQEKILCLIFHACKINSFTNDIEFIF
jgi:hypothetical protein